MHVWNGIDRYPENAPPACATIGNFDGVHRGHQRILDRVRARAAREQLPAVLVTFDPHPLAIVAPERRPALVHTRRQKLEALESCGLDGVLILSFDAGLARQSAQEFVDGLLATRLTLRALAVGEDFRFGRDRAGDARLLREAGAARGFDVELVPAVEIDGRKVSSSAIRSAVASGDVELAARMLGRPFAVEGVVVRGDGRGRRLRYPTANLALASELRPASGVYVTETVRGTTRHASVTNVGVRPTFGGRSPEIETHLLEFDGDLYGEAVDVRFLARIREERRFPGPSELADQIARDLATAEAFFQNARSG